MSPIFFKTPILLLKWAALSAKIGLIFSSFYKLSITYGGPGRLNAYNFIRALEIASSYADVYYVYYSRGDTRFDRGNLQQALPGINISAPKVNTQEKTQKW